MRAYILLVVALLCALLSPTSAEQTKVTLRGASADVPKTFSAQVRQNLQKLEVEPADDTPEEPSDDDKKKLSGGAIAGIVIGSVAGAGILGAGGFFAYTKMSAGAAELS